MPQKNHPRTTIVSPSSVLISMTSQGFTFTTGSATSRTVPPTSPDHPGRSPPALSGLPGKGGRREHLRLGRQPTNRPFGRERPGFCASASPQPVLSHQITHLPGGALLIVPVETLLLLLLQPFPGLPGRVIRIPGHGHLRPKLRWLVLG